MDTKYLTGSTLIRVVSIQEYEYATHLWDDDLSFFHRTNYNGTLSPSFNELTPRYCICNMPSSPDVVTVSCDSCDGWFHPECINAKVEDFTAICWLC